ncbi:MAG TPA: hypothetical protein P5121_33175, partial [Caldilineaceae bacterium]|nr:hypothetical protein [Caldilineaceae bacterium]
MANRWVPILPIDPNVLTPTTATNTHPTVHPGTQEAATDHLEARAQHLAAQHTDLQVEGRLLHDAPLPLPDYLPLLTTRLGNVYNYFADAAQQPLPANEQKTAYAAEWVLDNFYLLDQTRQEIEVDLPATYYRQLPKPTAVALGCGYPRVLMLARAFVIDEECQVDGRRLARYVAAYQQIQPLTMGELWALPIMLRFVLLTSVAQAAERLTGLVPGLETNDNVFDAALQLAHVADDNAIIAHSIPSLRAINSQNWNDFFEAVSLVQQILSKDPAAIYSRMDFATRDRYRSAIETIARTATQDEVGVAQAAVALAKAAYPATGLRTDSADTVEAETERLTVDPPVANWQLPRACHVGTYLVAEGRPLLEQEVGCRPSRHTARQRWILAHPALVYLGSISLLVTIVVALSVLYAANAGGVWWLIGLAGLLALLPAITLAVDVVNWGMTRFLPPRVLPKLDFIAGIPPTCRTMVVVPALIARTSDVESLLNQMELHYLRNPDPHLGFALLSDFADATQQQMPEDEALLIAAQAGFTALNQKYPAAPFYLFHRRRLWNSAEGAWMGWERKRGKLHEFNRLLRTPVDGTVATTYNTSHIVTLGDLTRLPQVRYVITLDADTILPREQAQQLIGTLAHPLNRAQFDPQSGKVVAGYTILQPRTEIKPMSANQSLFTRIFAGDVGIDLYSRAVSDLYQDLFGAGSYVGKGIYAVDAFEQSLAGRVPENTLLSHDLFEGMHGRVGLATDIVLYEDYPPHYLINIQRSHRWVRGDWQLLPWLLPWTPRAHLSSPTANFQSTTRTWERNDL